jgi:hypothetical protein
MQQQQQEQNGNKAINTNKKPLMGIVLRYKIQIL